MASKRRNMVQKNKTQETTENEMGGWWLLLGWMLLGACSAASERGSKAHSRQKRLLWITNDGRLALPPGTLLTVTPTISLPFVRYPPDGFLSNMTISLPFTINFDILGLTDNQNPYGVLPPILARSMGRSAGALLADYVASVINKRRKSRSAPQETNTGGIFHGGERAFLYVVVEDFLSNFGLDGKACVLRAICEIHGHSLKHFGFFGEFIKLFFTASKSPFANVLSDYVKAERWGLENGECFPYYKDCPKSIFLPVEKNKYKGTETEHTDVAEEIEMEEEEETQHTLGTSEITIKDIVHNALM